jgi:predicted MFS family arabinose efflux permease
VSSPQDFKTFDRDASRATPKAAWRALALLVAVNVFSQVDRQLMNILVEPVKAEFDLSDTQMGLLAGLAFALFYTLAGIPIARFADRWSRRNLIAICLALWSLFTVLCGAARSYLTLAFARFGVGVGEAGCAPAAQSMIADFFPPEARGRALATYQLGVPLAFLVGPVIGGFLAEAYGWRVAFVAVGLPGVVFALFVGRFLEEPVRGGFDGAEAAGEAPPFLDAVRYLWRRSAMRHTVAAASLQTATLGAWAVFIPAFLMREHGLTLGEVGWRYALIAGLGGSVGTLAGGWIGDRLGARDARWYIWAPMIGALVAIPTSTVAFTAPDLNAAVAFLVVMQIGGMTYAGVVHAVTQSLATPRIRALTAAIALFAMNLIGFGGGPYLAGRLSDWLGGENSLGHALVLMNIVLLWGCLHYALAGRSYRADLSRAD